MKSFWDSLDIMKFLAVAIALAFIALIFILVLLGKSVDKDVIQLVLVLSNAFMLLVGYYWGSSDGSKKKDAALLSAPTTPVPPAQP